MRVTAWEGSSSKSCSLSIFFLVIGSVKVNDGRDQPDS